MRGEPVTPDPTNDLTTLRERVARVEADSFPMPSDLNILATALLAVMDELAARGGAVKAVCASRIGGPYGDRECYLLEGHKGKHRDDHGVEWPDNSLPLNTPPCEGERCCRCLAVLDRSERSLGHDYYGDRIAHRGADRCISLLRARVAELEGLVGQQQAGVEGRWGVSVMALEGFDFPNWPLNTRVRVVPVAVDDSKEGGQ
jgi:hypothetical protein